MRNKINLRRDRLAQMVERSLHKNYHLSFSGDDLFRCDNINLRFISDLESSKYAVDHETYRMLERRMLSSSQENHLSERVCIPENWSYDDGDVLQLNQRRSTGH